MTRHDPFAYGQVPLNQKEQAAAPDDMLFADATPTKATAPAADSDWAPPADNGAFSMAGGSADALAFGADILGEKVQQTPPARPRPGAAPVPAAGSIAKPVSPRPAATLAAAAPAASPSRPVSRPALMPMMPRRSSTASVLVPIAAVGVGSASAWWLYEMQNNPVMAGIVGLLALVGAALARVMLRR